MDPVVIGFRAIQLNPNNPAYWLSRGFTGRPLNWIDIISQIPNMFPSAVVNRANQLNPNNIAYWLSRGFSYRPENWADLIASNKIITVPTWGQYLKQNLITCGHGLYKAACWLCTWKGLLFISTTVVVGVISYHLYLRHKERINQYAHHIPVYYITMKNNVISNMEGLPGYYGNAKTIIVNSNIWKYGVVTPYHTAVSSVVYTAGGLYSLTKKVGYYCNPSSHKPDQ